MAPSRSRRPLRLPGLRGSLMPKNSSPMRARARPPSRRRARPTVCISVSPVPPDFEIATKRVVASGSFASSAPIGRGIEIVHEMHARRVAERADAAHADAGKLRQRLPAEARAAGAEHHHVGRAGAQPRGGAVDLVEIVASAPAAAAAAGCRRRARRAASASAASLRSQRVVERRLADAVRADLLGARVVDVLRNGMPAALPRSAGKSSTLR